MWRVRQRSNPVNNLDYHIEHIKQKLQEALDAHQTEISRVDSLLKEKSIPSREKRALADKKILLQQQKQEIVKYHENIVRQLTEHGESRREHAINLDKLASSLRHNFEMECRRFRNPLPIYARRSDIVEMVRKNQVSVIIGETGSGKSTQIVQYLYEAGLADRGMIACTQPRKVAATNLATHVAHEMGSFVGQLVGHKVGGYTRRGLRTKILYITEHYMLKECLEDRKLSIYSCVVVDEAHERSINTDLLLGIIKKSLGIRPDLRVVVTSATIDPTVFVKYFRNCPVLHVSGRMFPVEVLWKDPENAVDAFSEYLEQAVQKAVEVHQSEGEGDILVFVTSPRETEMCCVKFWHLLRGRHDDCATLQLHGQMQREDQQKVFDPVPPGVRKVIFATNSAETSVTIPGIRYVIDTGLAREMRYDPVRKMRTLSLSKISQSSARQRLGRAGRVGPGKCFRLYTQEDYEERKADYVPEILRDHIGQAMLKVMEFDVDPTEFDYVVSPSGEAMKEAFSTLVDTGAVEGKKLTELGRWIAKLPFDPKFGVFIYEGVQKLVGLEAIVMTVASESSSELFIQDRSYSRARKSKNPFSNVGGDQLTALNVFREWYMLPAAEKLGWCSRHSINEKLMKVMQDTTEDIIHTLRKELDIFIKFEFLKPETADKFLLELLLKVFQKNLCYRVGEYERDYYILSQNQVVELHPSSVVPSLGRLPEWIVFKDIIQTTTKFAKDITPVPESLLLKAIEEGWVQLDIEEAKERCEIVPYHRHVGPQLFHEFVRSNSDHIRNMEVALTLKFPDSGMTIKTREDTGRITVLSTVTDEQRFAEAFLGCFLPFVKKYVQEQSEECLGARQAAGGCVRVVIGAGGVTKTILMPEEYRVVQIQCPADMRSKLSEKEVLGKFSKYGKINECQKFIREQEPSTVWGEITFQDPKSALKSVKGTAGSFNLTASPKEGHPVHPRVELKVKFVHRRKASKGRGCVEFRHLKDHQNAVKRKSLMVAGSLATIRDRNKPEKFIQIFGFGPHVTEHLLRDAVVDALCLSPTAIRNVYIARKHAPLTHEVLEAVENHLVCEIGKFVQPSNFRLEMQEPQPASDVNLIADCVFQNLEEGLKAFSELKKGLSFSGEGITVTEGLHSSVRIHESLYKEKCDVIKELICLYHIEGLHVSLKKKPGYMELNLHLEDETNAYIKLAVAKETFQREIHSGSIWLDDCPALFTEKGQSMLQMVRDKTGAVIVADGRVNEVAVHGSEQQTLAAKDEINKYLHESKTAETENCEVKVGRDLLRTLKSKYEDDLSGLLIETKLSSAEYENTSSKLKLKGSDEAIDRTFEILNEIWTTLVEDGVLKRRFECDGCFYSTEIKALHRVECCGHAFCEDCVGHMKKRLMNGDFPVECDAGSCSELLVWKDFLNLSRAGHIKLSDLVRASVRAHVAAHNTEFQYCPTTDCPIVYRIAGRGAPFQCPECDVTTCTFCHEPYYHGHTCLTYTSKQIKRAKFYRIEKENVNRTRGQGKIQTAKRQKSKFTVMSTEKIKKKRKGEKGRQRKLQMLLSEGLEEEYHTQERLSRPTSHLDVADAEKHKNPGLWQQHLHLYTNGKVEICDQINCHINVEE